MFIRGERNEGWARRREAMDARERRILFTVLCAVAICACTLLLARFRVYLPPYSAMDRDYYETRLNASGGTTMDRRSLDPAAYESLRRLAEESRFRYTPYPGSSVMGYERIWSIWGYTGRGSSVLINLVERSSGTTLYIQYGQGFRSTTFRAEVDPDSMDLLTVDGSAGHEWILVSF